MTLALTVFAVVVSLASAFYTWQMARNDNARRYESRRPEWAASLVQTGSGPGGTWRLDLELLSKEPVDQARLTSPDVGLIVFGGDQDGSPTMGPAAQTVRQVTPGARDTAWRVSIADPSPGGPARLRVTSTIGKTFWEDWIDVQLPLPPPQMRFI